MASQWRCDRSAFAHADGKSKCQPLTSENNRQRKQKIHTQILYAQSSVVRKQANW